MNLPGANKVVMLFVILMVIKHIVNSSASQQFWVQAYQGIYSANKVIEAIDDKASPSMLQIKGENFVSKSINAF